MRKEVLRVNYIKLALASLLVGLVSTLLADSLKRITGYYEDAIFKKAEHFSLLFIILPSIGITMIYFLRKYAFKNKQNKGIKEIYHTIEERRNELPAYKMPSHYINGFLTVIFGGSTGVEVSTVVATATVGAVARKRTGVAKAHKTELICAGVAAGIATLFCSPLAGLLFSVEVIARKVSKTILLSCLCSVFVSWLFMFFIENETIFKELSAAQWHIGALPMLIVVSALAGLLAVYFTKSVIFIKEKFGAINNNFLRVNIGALAVGIALLAFPQLYGDSYHAVPGLLHRIDSQTFKFTLPFALTLLCISLLKPLVASLTLGAGGDGGVFAPSIIGGAVFGMFVAIICNQYLHTQYSVLNFALIGGGAMLSAAIHAPLTSLFLTCNLVPNGFELFFPMLICCFIGKYSAKLVCSYTVYSYKGKKTKPKESPDPEMHLIG